MRRTALLLAAITMSFGSLGAVSAPAGACEGVDCFLACVEAAINNPKNPVCPA